MENMEVRLVEAEVLKNFVLNQILQLPEDTSIGIILSELTKLKKNDINSIARINWKWVDDMGWHGDRRVLESLALIGSEVGEASNECRGLKPTDSFPSELADIILRTCDLAYDMNIDIGEAINRKIDKNLSKGNYKNRSI